MKYRTHIRIVKNPRSYEVWASKSPYNTYTPRGSSKMIEFPIDFDIPDEAFDPQPIAEVQIPADNKKFAGEVRVKTAGEIALEKLKQKDDKVDNIPF